MLSFRITTLWRNSLSFKSQIIPCSESVVGAGRRKWPSPVQGLMGTLQPVRRIHTSRPRYLNPIIVAVLRPLSKMVAVLVGRGFRKWWQSLPKKKKDIFIQHFIRNKFRYLGGSTMLGLAGYTYYESHVTTTPFTRRRRFMVFTPDQLFKIAQSCYQVELAEYGHLLLPENHSMVDRVRRVGNRILQANNTIPQLYTKEWTVTVIDHPMVNCFVLPVGHFTLNYHSAITVDSTSGVRKYLCTETYLITVLYPLKIFQRSY
ncbi:Metalloendopeptidase OMA1-like 2 [Homarus americanus]|uniref:Metalloendopeptidase OMA1-like 2 n=1 Tax=Homarus americanus TaxID=6706 RepID=A0A8J5JZ74_HOMAM|nr:Metalloendopeptidase OMA1-like 2 [Homarus americanus]